MTDNVTRLVRPERTTSAPLVGNRHMPHTWSPPKEGEAIKCLRCGAEWGSTESCP